MGKTYYMRIWQRVDIEQIQKHLMIVGDVSGDCASCREVGLKYVEVKTCPQCGVEFKFMSARTAGSLKSSGAHVRRLKERRPDLTFVDYEDYKNITGAKKARDFFG